MILSLVFAHKLLTHRFFQASTKLIWPAQSRICTYCYSLRWPSFTLICPRFKESAMICSKNTSRKLQINNDKHILWPSKTKKINCLCVFESRNSMHPIVNEARTVSWSWHRFLDYFWKILSIFTTKTSGPILGEVGLKFRFS